MVRKVELVKAIIKGLHDLRNLSPQEIMKGDYVPLPRLIPDGNGNTIQITKLIDQNISELATALMSEGSAHVKNVRAEEWRSWVRSAVRPASMQVNETDLSDEATASVLTHIEGEISRLFSDFKVSEYAFGTTFLQIPDVSPFKIGPVEFERRDTWLNRKLRDGDISDVMHRRIQRIWKGDRVRLRKRNVDRMRESDILDAIGAAPVVCTVRVPELSQEAGREMSLTAARLALACIATLWERPTRTLSGLRLIIDGGIRRERMLRFVPGRITLQGSRMVGLPSGPHLTKTEWETLVRDFARYFSCVGEVISYLVSAHGQVERSAMMNTLLQSLIWFNEGCRETNDLLAIVDFAASLDALGGGQKARAILEVLEARLGLTGDVSIYENGPTLKKLIDTIYSDGRSRTIHGTSDKIGHDWTLVRGQAESIARLALLASLKWVGENAVVKDPSALRSVQAAPEERNSAGR